MKITDVQAIPLSIPQRMKFAATTTGLNPEPYAYEEAFTMRWLIQDQIAGKPELNYDPINRNFKGGTLVCTMADGSKRR